MTDVKTAAEWRTEARHLRDEVQTLKRSLAESQELHGQSGIIDSDFINRSSLGHLRNKTWAAFSATVRGLPQSFIDLGFDECRTQSVSDLLADLRTMGLTPARSEDVTQRQSDAAKMLETRPFFAVLSHPGSEYCERCYRFWGDVRPPRMLGHVPCKAGRDHKRGNRGYDYVRVRFIGEVNEIYYRVGVWSLFVRAPETIVMPGYMGRGGDDGGGDGDA